MCRAKRRNWEDKVRIIENNLPIIRKKLLFSILLTAAVISAAVWYLALPKIESWQGNHDFSELQQSSYIKLLFVGDLMFDRGIRFYAKQNGGNDFIFEKISPFLSQNDSVVANLEGPITDNKSVSSGTIAGSTNNYFFTFDPSVAQTLYKQNIKIVDIGNNHILNFGREGLASTKEYLDKAKVGYFGSPDYPKSTSTQIGGVKITFISYNQFANLDPEIEAKSTIEEIQKAKGFSDIIMVFAHWGDEYQLTENQNQKDLGHKFIDAGADFVIGSHPHVIEPMETYNGKRIYYSLGNFIFDQYFDENVRRGLGVIVKIDKKTKSLDFAEQNFYLNSNGQTILQ